MPEVKQYFYEQDVITHNHTLKINELEEEVKFLKNQNLFLEHVLKENGIEVVPGTKAEFNDPAFRNEEYRLLLHEYSNLEQRMAAVIIENICLKKKIMEQQKQDENYKGVIQE